MAGNWYAPAPALDLASKPWTSSTLEFIRVREDTDRTTDLTNCYSHVVDSLLDHLVKYSQFKLPRALAIPPSEPDGGSSPRGLRNHGMTGTIPTVSSGFRVARSVALRSGGSVWRRVARAGLSAALAALLGCATAPPDYVRPNILLIVSEDNGPELGAYGDPFARTPVLDTLARSGVLFRNAYVPQAGCSQSRAALLTGFYPHQNGQIGLATWKFGLYRDDTPNIVSSLKESGYRTGIIGKLHINPAEAFPFDFVRIPGANFQRKDLASYSALAASFIEESEAPFLLSVNYPDAHRPFLRQVDGLPADPISEDEVVPLPYIGLDSPTLRRDSANYHNSMSRLDSLIGDLLEALDRSGKSENTIVVYLGDHGADLLRGKRTCYEGGLRVPLIMRWPGKQAGGQVRNGACLDH